MHESQPQWEKWGSKSAKLKYWTKESTLKYFEDLYGNRVFAESPHIMGGILFMKNKENSFLKNWLDITLHHPELIIDPSPEEIARQPEGFAGHRHDQSVITPLALHDPSVIIMPEIMEKEEYHSFIWASRIRARNRWQAIAFSLKHWAGKILGPRFYNFGKRLLNK